MMTGIEKLEAMNQIMSGKRDGYTWEEAEQLRTLREGLKVSDWFIWTGETETTVEKFYKFFGWETVVGNRKNEKLEKAIEDGFVKRTDYRNYGRYIFCIALTAKGRKAIAKAKHG